MEKAQEEANLTVLTRFELYMNLWRNGFIALKNINEDLEKQKEMLEQKVESLQLEVESWKRKEGVR